MTAAPRTTPVVPGVYFLFREGVLVYVGQSKDCHDRIDTHRRNGRPFDLATVMPLDPQLLGQVEKALIKAYKPSSNIAHVPRPEPEEERRQVARMFPRVVADEPNYGPGPDGLGNISRGKARELASAYGVMGKAIAEGEAEGELRFVPTGKVSGRGMIHVARFDEVAAYLRKRQQRRIEELGLGHVRRQEAAE